MVVSQQFHYYYSGWIFALFSWLNFLCFSKSQELDYVLDSEHISNRYNNYLTYFVAYVIVKRFENNEPAYSVEDIVKSTKCRYGL